MTFSISLNAQTYSDQNSDREIHLFIELNKKYFGRNNLDNKILNWNYCELYFDSKNCWIGDNIQKDSDNLITNECIADFQLRFKGLKQDSIESFRNLKERSDRKKYYRVSIPIISTDGNLAIIKISFWCGDECGSGGIMIFKKVGINKWKMVDMRNTWVS